MTKGSGHYFTSVEEMAQRMCSCPTDSRPKWTLEFRELKVGDIVHVIQPHAPRGRWPLGRIVKVMATPVQLKLRVE